MSLLFGGQNENYSEEVRRRLFSMQASFAAVESALISGASPVDIALIYARHGVRVSPVCRETARPIGLLGVKSATWNLERVERDWTKAPNAMIAAPTGRPNGLIVHRIRVDQYRAAASHDVGCSKTVRLPNGSLDMYSVILDLPVRQSRLVDEMAGELSKVMPVGKVLGTGDFVILPGSINAEGKRYPLPVHSDQYLAHLREEKSKCS